VPKSVAPPPPKKQKYIPRKQFLAQKHAGVIPGSVQFIDYKPRGAIKQIFSLRIPEWVLSGPAGTGKSRGCLEKAHWMLEKYPNARGLMVRKTRNSMNQSCIVTFENKVLPTPTYVPFHTTDQEYRYPNGSIFAVAGIDDPKKIYSSEWDFCYVNQAEELTEDDWENIKSRLRNWKMPYQSLFADCNPDAPSHWIRTRAATGMLQLLESRHEDNPELWDEVNKCWTERGRQYVLEILDKLTGVRYKRLRLGQWAAAEGTVYEDVWDRAVHIIDRFYPNVPLDRDQVPPDWPRYWVIDFGYTNPFVWQAWAEDPDGRLIRYKEIYHTKRLVEDHARQILEVTKYDPKPKLIVCDHDAEDRATLEKYLGMPTKAAWKSVSPGIQAVAARLRVQDDGKPRLMYMRDSVIELDQELLRQHLPTSTEDEYDVYAWDIATAGKPRKRGIGEEPIKKYDHGMDDTRYIVTYIDKTWEIKPHLFKMISVTKSGSDTPDNLHSGSGWRMGNTNAPSKFGGGSGRFRE
jgi:phage terminase large subunit